MKKLYVGLMAGLLMLCLSGMAQAALTYEGQTLHLETLPGQHLTLTPVSPGPYQTQSGLMVGTLNGEDWLLDYGPALEWELTNLDTGWVSGGSYGWQSGSSSPLTATTGTSLTSAQLMGGAGPELYYIDAPGAYDFATGVIFWEGSADMVFTANAPAPVPVPAAVWLLGSGLIGLAVKRRKK